MVGQGIVVGSQVWIPDKDHAWVYGVVTVVSAKHLEVKTDRGNARITGADVELVELCGTNMDADMENLVDLDELTEGSILHHVKKRYDRDLVYTHVGSILVAVNPFKMLNIYGEDEIQKFKRLAPSGRAPPHVYGAAAVAYDQLMRHKHSQSILISGESGAGKTETTKKVLQFVASIAGGHRPGEVGIEQQILQSNPVLEAFGNAKTLRNNNSSRFGKWMEVHMNASCKVVGCRIVNYLLEKSRVVRQTQNERNYHVMYMLIAGADGPLRERLGLGQASDFRYLSGGNCFTVDEIDDRQEFHGVNRAFADLGFTAAESDQIYATLGAIMHLGNVDFVDGKADESSEVTSSSLDLVRHIATLLQVSEQQLIECVTVKVVSMGRNNVVTLHLKPDQARDTRDALAKSLYSRMFDWLIQRINMSLQKETPAVSLGVLDIFGFEVFQTNSFEQLCINYANEKLQEHFNTIMFSAELQMYESEGVPCDHIEFADNAKCVELVEGRPIGIMALLEEECSLGQGTDQSLLSKLDSIFGGSSSKHANEYYQMERKQKLDFAIRHFAGSVSYTVTGFLDKNKDVLPDGCVQTCKASGLPLIAQWFADNGDAQADGPSKKKAIKTLGNQFRSQLASLMSTLAETEPHFIRCIKPNHQKTANNFDAPLCLRQLKYAGLFEAIRIRKSGYAYRIMLDQFVLRYGILLPSMIDTIYNRQRRFDAAAISNQILEAATQGGHIPPEQWRVGRTRVFLKSNADRSVLEQLRQKAADQYAVKLQKIARGFTTRRRVYAVRYEKQREERRLEQERKKRLQSAVMIQKIYRGYLARNVWHQLKEVFVLRRATQAQDECALENALKDFEHRIILAPVVQKEVNLARATLNKLKAKRKLLADLAVALNLQHVEKLEKLLQRAERLELEDHMDVLDAKRELLRLKEKRRVIAALEAFVQDSTEGLASVPDLIQEASSLGVDVALIGEAQQAYNFAAPRVLARNRLRVAIKLGDKPTIEQCIQEIGELNGGDGRFGLAEMTAGKQLLRLFQFEKQLSPQAVTDQWPVLNPELVRLCGEISLTKQPAALKRLRTELRSLCGSLDRYERVIRVYKWSSMCALCEMANVAEPEDDLCVFHGFCPSAAGRSPMISSLLQAAGISRAQPASQTTASTVATHEGGRDPTTRPADLESVGDASMSDTASQAGSSVSTAQSGKSSKSWRDNMARRTLSPLEAQLLESRQRVERQKKQLQRGFEQMRKERTVRAGWR